ncbi:MAG: aldo/keto reductase [Chromatiales bacterium]|nr:aldo/keto reductase [Chromatiales bacterium]
MTDRRTFLARLAATAALGGAALSSTALGSKALGSTALGSANVAAGGATGRGATKLLSRVIPSSGEALPVIGMGTSRTFDVAAEPAALRPLAEVVRALFDGGATLIDSSPMYGRAEAVTGRLLSDLGNPGVFAATKVWADGREAGIRQMEESFRLLGVPRMDLMQVHNLRDWRTHLATLREWKESGRIRYVGITTSRKDQYGEFAAVMRAEPLDFVQLNYSLGEREAEQVLLPLARDRGMAVLVNRPYMRGELFSRVRGKALPAWASELDCTTWGQLFMKFILAHPAVTCVIPATTSVRNMQDNLAGGSGQLPDEALRQRMIAAIG